jgi:hypothetical protein
MNANDPRSRRTRNPKRSSQHPRVTVGDGEPAFRGRDGPRSQPQLQRWSWHGSDNSFASNSNVGVGDLRRSFRPVRHLVDQAIAALSAEDRLIATAAGGMRLHTWLPTRTFELAVHSLDIAAATGVSADLPDQVISDAAALAARIAAATGDGPAVLLALTGRGHLTRDFLGHLS